MGSFCVSENGSVRKLLELIALVKPGLQIRFNPFLIRLIRGMFYFAFLC